MNGYEVKILEASMELSKKEKVALKDTTNAVKLDVATQNAPVDIDVLGYVVLGIHNEKSDNKDYNNYVVIGTDGTKYITGSESFWSTFKNIFDEMEGEAFSIKCYRADSKNYKGKQFITCSIM